MSPLSQWHPVALSQQWALGILPLKRETSAHVGPIIVPSEVENWDTEARELGSCVGKSQKGDEVVTELHPVGPSWDRPFPHIVCCSSSLKSLDNSI